MSNLEYVSSKLILLLEKGAKMKNTRNSFWIEGNY